MLCLLPEDCSTPLSHTMVPENILECLPADSFIKRWVEAWPAAEPPNSYLIISAMSMFGAGLGRKVWLQEDFRQLWPMLNVLLIGPSGIGKSTSIELAQRLVYSLPAADRPDFILGASPEKLHADLVIQPHAVLVASELANFFNRQKYMEGMIPYITELLDCKPVEKRTKTSDVLRVSEPTVTVIGGSTPEWLQEQLPDSATSGGFLARFLIVKEDERRKRVADASTYLPKALKLELEHKRALLFTDYLKLLHKHSGRVSYYDFSVADTYQEWYEKHQPPTGHLAPFAARAGEFVKRMSMILALSAGSCEIREQDLKAAIALYSYTEKKLQEVVVPYSQQGRLVAKCLESILPQGSSESQIFQAMRNFVTAHEAQKLLTSLLMSKDIRHTDGRYYRI